MADFTHLTRSGFSTMVDIGGKAETARQATVSGRVQVSSECARKLTPDMLREMTTVARIAGIQAAKATSTLIPFCHPIALTFVEVGVRFDGEANLFELEAKAATEAPTGVEMEALVAVHLAALTLYDLIKAVDPGAVLGPFRLEDKRGGKGGSWSRPQRIQV